MFLQHESKRFNYLQNQLSSFFCYFYFIYIAYHCWSQIFCQFTPIKQIISFTQLYVLIKYLIHYKSYQFNRKSQKAIKQSAYLSILLISFMSVLLKCQISFQQIFNSIILKLNHAFNQSSQIIFENYSFLHNLQRISKLCILTKIFIKISRIKVQILTALIKYLQKINNLKKKIISMLLQNSAVTEVRRNNFESSMNPEQPSLTSSRFNSPSLKLGRIRSWKFIYKSPTRVEQGNTEGPLAFNKQAHKLIVRKLPKLHDEIHEDDPLKNSKVIENINYFREQQRRKLGLTDSQGNTTERTKVSGNHFEVSRVLVDLRGSKHPVDLKMSRSLSCSYKVLDSSRMSVIEGLKSGESLYQSMVKHEGPLMQSRILQTKRSQPKINLAQSQYFAGIIGK